MRHIIPFFLFTAIMLVAEIPLTTQALDNNTYQITLDFPLAPEDWIYHDYLTLSSDSPHLKLSAWQPSYEPIPRYIPAFKQTKKIYPTPFSISVTAQVTGALSGNYNMHVTYYKKSDNKITHHVIPLTLPETQLTPTAESPAQAIEITQETPALSTPVVHSSKISVPIPTPWHSSLLTTYRTHEIQTHLALIIALILLLACLRQRDKLRTLTRNMGLFALLYSYYALAEQNIPTPYRWFLIAILTMFTGVAIIKRAEHMRSTRSSHLVSLISLGGMIMLACSIILLAKTAQAYYIFFIL